MLIGCPTKPTQPSAIMGKREALAQDLLMRLPMGAALQADNSGGGKEHELRHNKKEGDG
jgi:hypothetical protein